MIHLDTHVVVWLYAGEVERFPASVRDLLSAYSLSVSPMVVMELQYLQEIGRISASPPAIMGDLAARLGLTVDPTPFESVVQASLLFRWTRDPFDRLIAAQAQVARCPLLTRDATIRMHFSAAVWES